MQAQTLIDGTAEAITNTFSGDKRTVQTSSVVCWTGVTNKGAAQ